MMQRVAATVAALCALAGAAQAADGLRGPVYATQPIVTGDIEVGLGRLNSAGGTNAGVFTGTGRANMPVGGAMNIELQSTANAVYLNGASQQWNDVYAHAWWRSSNSAWGIFGGTEFIGQMLHAVGGEGKLYFGNVSLTGEVARLWTSSTPTSALWEAAGSVNVYLNPNLRIGGGVQVFSGATATDLWVWSIDAEARFAGAPWSIWGYASSYNANNATSYVALAGFKWFLDAPNSTLQSHEKDVPFWFKSLAPIF